MAPEDLIEYKGTGYEGRSWTSKAKTFADALKMIDSLDSLVGRKGTIIPKDSDDDSAWEKFYGDMKAKPEEYKSLLKDKISDKNLDKIVSAMEKTGISKRQARELSDVLGDTIKNNFTEHYSPEKMAELVSKSELGDVDSLKATVEKHLGEGFFTKENTGSNESTVNMLKLVKGLTEEFAINNPIEPTTKPANGQSGSDPFAEGFTKGVGGQFGVKLN